MKTKVPAFFWFIASIALLWNLMGCASYVGMQMMSPEALEALSETERDLFLNTPTWVTAAFAIAVWFGLLGCILLLLRKAAAHPIFVISLLGIMVEQIWNFTIGNAIKVHGAEQVILPITVFLIGIYLIVFTKKAKANNWIN